MIDKKPSSQQASDSQELILTFHQLFMMALDGDKDAAIFILTKFPEMSQKTKDMIWKASQLERSGRRVSDQSLEIWLTIEFAKLGGKTIQEGIRSCAELFGLDEETIKKSWDRMRRSNIELGVDFNSLITLTGVKSKLKDV